MLFTFHYSLFTIVTTIGNYRIEERIGRGGMGIVYRGHHLKLPREVAIKSISSNSSRRDLRRLRHRFEKEAFVQSQLDHPGIVKIYDYIVAEQTYYIVMEFVEGRSLAHLLQREVCPLPTERALDLFEQMLGSIAYAQEFIYQDQDGSSHRGLIHRDLKPANMLITPDDRVKISDFGIVKLVGSEKTNTGEDYGSPEYVSPEQAEGAELDPRSDIYSLGIILYEMLTGKPPFHNQEGKLSQLDIVRAHIQPVLPPDAPTPLRETRVTLIINGTDCGSRLIPVEQPRTALIQEWQVDSLLVRLRASRGQPLSIRFMVKVDADRPFGLNISNWPEGFDAHEAKPVEVEVR